MPIDNDDLPVGRILTRRDLVRLLGGAGAGGMLWLAGCGGNQRPSVAGDAGAAAAGSGGAVGMLDCAAKPDMTLGPYYVDTGLTRADIRTDGSTGTAEEGVPLELAFSVARIAAGACTPLQGAVVDVWHCNALGVYSGVRDPGFDTTGQTWLRGKQRTDARGRAAFTTIFPGWYRGRASHIHFTIRSPAAAGTYEFTSQLFFEEALLTSIYTGTAPYDARGDEGRQRNAEDGIYRRGGSQLVVRTERVGDEYRAEFRIGLEMA
jgi:protocatechuate 3,4-dioxygenase beta subunit